MGLATLQDVIDEGWRTEQFGSPADFVTASTGYLARVLAKASAWAIEQYGVAAVTYAAISTTSAIGSLLIQAELLYTAHLLWARRAKFSDGNASMSLQESQYLTQREYLEASAQALVDAYQAISDALVAGGSDAEIPGSGIAVGYVQSGAFSDVVDVA